MVNFVLSVVSDPPTSCRIESPFVSVLISSSVMAVGVAWLTTEFTYSSATFAARVLSFLSDGTGCQDI